MSTPELTSMPESFAAGTTLTYLRTLTDYDPSADELKVYLRGASTADITATDEDGAFRVTLAATATALLDPGLYHWVERVTTAGGLVYDVATGTLNVTADLATADAGELQSWAEKTLPVVEAAIAGRLTTDQESYQVLGRAVTRIPTTELFAIRNKLRALVSQEMRKRFATPVKFRFGRD